MIEGSGGNQEPRSRIARNAALRRLAGNRTSELSAHKATRAAGPRCAQSPARALTTNRGLPPNARSKVPDILEGNMPKHVVIIGGGFGGLEAARRLERADVRVTLLDRRNHHLFQPLLYQVATAALNPSDIAYPIRSVLKDQENARVLLAEATSIDAANHRVVLDDGELTYDYLVVAAGATHSYFGNDWSEVAPGLKSVEDALEIRRRVFLAYEAAERESDPVAQRAWLTFVVVGAGPTGVELAGALGEIGLHTLAGDFRRIDPTQVRVLLVEGRDRVLGAYPEKLSVAAKRSLEQRKVEVRLNSKVTAIDAHRVVLSAGGKEEEVLAHTVLWAAGVQGSPLAATLPAARDRSGRVEVGADLALPGHPEIFVIGDLARMMSDGKEVPGVAQGALQSGRHVAGIISDEVSARRAPGAEPRPAFHYKDKGSLATIGRASAVVATKGYVGHGRIAYLIWWVVHIAFLVGFRNRLLVMFSWAWSWLTFQRGARLITGDIGPLPPVAGISKEGVATLGPAGNVVELLRERDETVKERNA
jgi:NADH:ubiquinone reductase (H+-translocating)